MNDVDRLLQSYALPLWLGEGLLATVCGLGLLAGCSGFSSEEAPLPDSTFTRVLTEYHLAKTRYSLDAPYPPGLRDSILARYEVAPSEFDAALNYYSRHPKTFESLYQSVIDTLQALQRPGPGSERPDAVSDSLSRTDPRESQSP
ncbi:MAG: DUF4296 domain-containing protein [Bacteroidetes bacterium QH_2_64_74]|nr:MAG: DUF4296 domain-containing protein [Bacteroidetes bacterium QH_2_64_74]